MSARGWLRALAGVFLFFTLGHTLGTLSTVSQDPRETALIDAMQALRLPVMGFERTYWEFYRGFSLTGSVLMAMLTVMAWQFAKLSRDHPRETLPFVITVLIGNIGNAVLCWMYFFWPPIITAVLTVVCAAGAVMTLMKQAETQTGP